jgi:multidrug transporter EmrE-like cation transporter
MKLKLTVNILRVIVALSVLGLAVQTYDFISQPSIFDTSVQSLPYLFEMWFFGGRFVYPAWYPLILMVLAIIGLRFGESRSGVTDAVTSSVS